MAEESTFPFQLNNIFLTLLQFNRGPEMPETQEFELQVELNVTEIDVPKRLQLVLKVGTIGEPALTFRIELVGLFDNIEAEPEPDRSRIWSFINERALYMMWPYVTQTVRQITTQMGINPVSLRTPHKFEFTPTEIAKPSERLR